MPPAVSLLLLPAALLLLARADMRPKNATPSHEHKLMKALFKNYDPSVRPRYNSANTVQVSVRFSLQQINDLDEKRQILKISGWLTAEWSDEFLQWAPEEFGGLSTMVIEPKRMWIPKLAIGNSANKLFYGEHYRRFWITVRSNGECRWQPGGVFSIACALDMNFYPFDDQRCTMEIETWVYTSDKVNLSSSMNFVGLDTYIPHGEWTIIRTEARSINVIYRYYLTEAFPEVYFTIFIRRKYTFYFMYILLPCLMLSGVLLMIFMLPADSGEKVSLGVSILVAISVFLLLVAGNVPDTSDAIPIIAIYLTYFMMATTMAVACSVIVIKLHFKSADTKPPPWLRILCFKHLARIMRMEHHKRYYSIAVKKRQRDYTWSETLTDELKSQNSHNTLSPDGGTENFELLHQRRKQFVSGDESDSQEQNASGHLHGSGDRHTTLRAQDLRPGELTFEEQHIVNEWKKIAEVIDRLFFFVFLFFIIVPTSTILGIVRLFKPEL